MPEGTIKWFDAAKGYGLIAPDKGDKDVIFKAVALAGFEGEPTHGLRVEFEPKDPRRGTEAASVRPI